MSAEGGKINKIKLSLILSILLKGVPLKNTSSTNRTNIQALQALLCFAGSTVKGPLW